MTNNLIQTYDNGDGSVTTVIWLNDDFEPVPSNEATMAKFISSDGEVSFFYVNADKNPRAAAALPQGSEVLRSMKVGQVEQVGGKRVIKTREGWIVRGKKLYSVRNIHDVMRLVTADK